MRLYTLLVRASAMKWLRNDFVVLSALSVADDLTEREARSVTGLPQRLVTRALRRLTGGKLIEYRFDWRSAPAIAGIMRYRITEQGREYLPNLAEWLRSSRVGNDDAYRAGCITQDVMVNGGNRWCEDLPYPPQDEAGRPGR